MADRYPDSQIDDRFNHILQKMDWMHNENKVSISIMDRDNKLILEQTTKHNGRLTKVERILLILGCVTGTLLIVNGSELLNFLKSVI